MADGEEPPRSGHGTSDVIFIKYGGDVPRHTAHKENKMEPLFENRFYDNYKMIAEFARKYSVGPRLPILIACWIVYPISLTICILSGAIRETGYLFIVLGAVMLFVAFLPNWYSWQTMKNTKKQNDGVLPETIITFGDTIELHEGMVHISVEYRKIVGTVRLKHSYVLMLGKRNGVILQPNSFTKGSFEEFKKFLREKCPDLKVVE